MGGITINVKYSNNEVVPPSSLEYSLRTSILDAHNWVSNNEFTNLTPNTYYYSVRRKSDNVIISNGSQIITDSPSSSEIPFEITVSNQSEITISKTQHQKNKVKNVLVFDESDWSLTANWQKVGDEGVLVVLSEPQTVTIRIS